MPKRQTSTATAERLLRTADAMDHPANSYDEELAFNLDQQDVATLRKAANILENFVEEGGDFNPDTCLDGEEE